MPYCTPKKSSLPLHRDFKFIQIMVQGKRTNSKPKFAEVVIGDNEAKEMREPVNARSHRNPYLVTIYFSILPTKK